jgi:hypothetical protein
MGKSQVAEKRKTVAVETPVARDEPTCQHHWIIESPRGALSAGHCKVCGEEREFRNSTSDYVWDNDSGSGYSPWRGVRSGPKAPDDDEMAASSRTGTHTLAV